MSTPIVGYQQANSYTAAKDRQVQVHKLHHDAASGGIIPGRSGVIMGSASNLDAIRNGSNLMAVDVAPGMAQVGTYAVAVGTGVTLTCQPSTSTARRDLVILRVYDQESGDGYSEAKLELVKGTTTVDPALPARSLIIAQCDIGANATQITVVDRRFFTSAAGGVIPMTTALPVTYDQVAPGDQVFSLNTGNSWQRVGNALIPLLGQAAQLTATRLSNDATAASTWGTLLSASGTMPAGTYLVITNCLWYPEPSGTQYTWLKANVNGSNVGVPQGYVGLKMNDSPNCHVLMGVYTHGGGTMTMQAEYGFSNVQIWGCKGSQMTAVRIGP
jgi:hypothetical protein